MSRYHLSEDPLEVVLEDEYTTGMKRYRLIVDDGGGYSVKITPNASGEFDVEVWSEKYAYVVGDGIGAINGMKLGYVERFEERRSNICASSVDGVRTALQEFDVTLPDSLAERLSDWQQDYSEAYEAYLDDLRRSFEDEEPVAPEMEQKIATENREFIEGFDCYFVEHERGWAKITPSQGVFDVEIVRTGYTDYEEDYTGEIYRGLCIEQCSETRELTVEDVRKVLDQSDIKLPDGLAEKLSEWRREFWEGQADELRMAAAEAGDWDESPIPGMDSPDERFPTKEAYEAALERMEMEGIARVE